MPGKFHQHDFTGIALYKDANEIHKKYGLHTFGFIYALKLSNDETTKLLNAEKDSKLELLNAWNMAEANFDLQQDFGRLNSLNDDTKIALRAYTLESPFYRDFNSKCRNLLSFFDWENFPYKGMFLTLHRAVSSEAGACESTILYRGIPLWTNILVGSVVKFQQFTSATSNRTIAYNLFGGSEGTLFIFSNITHALGLSSLSTIPSEEEFLILPTDGFKVIDKKQNGKVLEIYLESMQSSLLF